MHRSAMILVLCAAGAAALVTGRPADRPGPAEVVPAHAAATDVGTPDMRSDWDPALPAPIGGSAPDAEPWSDAVLRTGVYLSGLDFPLRLQFALGPRGVRGTIYALERGGDLVELDLADFRHQVWPLPDALREAAAREVAVLPDGLVIYERFGNAAAAFPFNDPTGVRMLVGERIVGVAQERVLSAPPGATSYRLLDGSGELVGELPIAEGDDGRDPSMAVVGDLVLRRPYGEPLLTWTSLSTGETRSTPFLGLGPSNRDRFLAYAEGDGGCVVLRGWWTTWVDGPFERVDGVDCDAFATQGVLSPDGRSVAYSTAEAGDLGRTHVFDLEQEVTRDVFAIDGYLEPAGFTADGDHLLMTDGLTDGWVTIVPSDGSGVWHTVEFDVPLLAVVLASPSAGR